MWVTWVTFDDTRESIAVYGTNKPEKRVLGDSNKFVDGGITRKVRYVHRVLLADLEPGQGYGKSEVVCYGSAGGGKARFKVRYGSNQPINSLVLLIRRAVPRTMSCRAMGNAVPFCGYHSTGNKCRVFTVP